MRWIFLSATHAGMIAVGFALGIYLLPILTAPDSLDRDMLAATAQNAEYKATFTKDLAGSDFLHWGEGDVSISFTKIVHQGKMAPGPNYKLYLVKEFVEDEAGFLAIKDQAQVIGDIKTFDGVVLDVPAGVDINAYNTVLVWCEAFQRITRAEKITTGNGMVLHRPLVHKMTPTVAPWRVTVNHQKHSSHRSRLG
ncbi:DM13 domain-containing protein, partial [Rhodospirillales bacterium]|nr:DM13 domain-containing protein [Rhodospirillales bacterium]